jgi:hypothetical protein
MRRAKFGKQKARSVRVKAAKLTQIPAATLPYASAIFDPQAHAKGKSPVWGLLPKPRDNRSFNVLSHYFASTAKREKPQPSQSWSRSRCCEVADI